MKKLVLVMAAVGGLGIASPTFATENTTTNSVVKSERIQLAQAVTVRVARPAVRKKVVVTTRRPATRVIVKKPRTVKRVIVR